MKTILLILSFFLLQCVAFAQSSFKQNDIYIELGGNSFFAGVNYERQLTHKPGLGVRFGLGVYGEKAFYLTIPVGINYLFPLKNDRSLIEAGLGVTWARVDGRIFSKEDNITSDHFTSFVPSIGYRRHTRRNVMWRISAAPVINKDGLFPWLGISLGKRF